jgi:hypothetical protein
VIAWVRSHVDPMFGLTVLALIGAVICILWIQP